ncbi:hypothetical protein CFC21_006830 [Triticum aestivum]|uniref:NADH dehydrogenase [ubiquinone] 1 alpha subcomplex subunit 12 n=3 Tax=Triticum TaxID=4564 RepID=A0A9R0QVN4_TRITD|nr:hypothetical protein CFC21_006830 [Triticum aestivum]VAH17599.1 unnamed protein product [Triticum turgidum subsp. durum]
MVLFTENALGTETYCKSSLPSLQFCRKGCVVLCLSVQTSLLFRQTKIHNIGATLVGVDTFGNKYYEKLHDTQYGRHRWVEYADKGRYNASQVPAEWHGWLHHITDSTGDKLLEEKTKKFIREHRQNYTGQGDDLIYHSKGHALNPGQRDWTRYQPWEPKKEEAT